MALKYLIPIEYILLDHLPRDGNVSWEGCLFLACVSALWAGRGPGAPFAEEERGVWLAAPDTSPLGTLLLP